MSKKTMTMIFSCAGFDTEEELGVLDSDGQVVTLDTDEDFSNCKKFNLKTGVCLNDNTAFGCSRKLKLSSKG